jgi:hypothetical protein
VTDPSGRVDTLGHSRAEVVAGLSESAEQVGGTAPHIDYGIWVAG